ncbi:pyridoxamine 5'-phosphate oxidase family protein, partial [Pseudomonas aeruginosa]
MLDKKLLEVLTSPPDAAVAIVTQGKDGPHVVNSWNSYAQITEDDKILFPAGRMNETEQNIRANNRLGITKYSIVTNSNDSVTLRLMTEHDLAMLYEWLNRS